MTGTPLFLLGTGRSGTTLVQRLLNSYEDILVWGEHSGYLRELSKAYNILIQSPSLEKYSYSVNRSYPKELDASVFKDPSRWQAWNNWYTRDDIRSIFCKHIQDTFRPLSLGAFDYWGFKEIRYGLDDTVLEFLLELFPNAKFVFVVRHGLNTVESQLNTFYQGNSRYLWLKRLVQLPIAVRIARTWRNQNKRFQQFSEQNPKNCHIFRYEDIHRSDRLQLLFDFVGKSVGPEQLEILEMKSGRGSSFDQSSDENERWKRLGPIPTLVLTRVLGSVSKELGY